MAEYESLIGTMSADGNMRGTLNLPRSGGTTDYEELDNKPQIEGVTLIGNKTFEELTLIHLTNLEIESMLT